MPDEPRLHIVQCLCGPEARHCILALAYLPGVPDDSGMILTEENASAFLRAAVEHFVAHDIIDPWCALCRAKQDAWIYEDARSKYRTIAEAEPHLREAEEQQATLRDMLHRGRN